MRHRIGTCSNCDNPEARHDYCPNCGHGDPLHAATESELNRLRAELAEALKDAERYRWLRECGDAFDPPELAEALKEARPCVEEIADHKAASMYALLARIDAALAKAGAV